MKKLCLIALMLATSIALPAFAGCGCQPTPPPQDTPQAAHGSRDVQNTKKVNGLPNEKDKVDNLNRDTSIEEDMEMFEQTE